MKILDNTHLMMLEPEQPTELLQDIWTKRARSFMFWLKRGVSYHGCHQCSCGAASESFTLITPYRRVTNSLLLHYIETHRAEVPAQELVKLYAELYCNNDLADAKIQITIEQERQPAESPAVDVPRAMAQFIDRATLGEVYQRVAERKKNMIDE